MKSAIRMQFPLRVELTGIAGMPLVEPGDDLAAIVISAMERAALAPRSGDVLVVAQKIVSKAEGRFVDLGTVEPSARALEVGKAVAKEPRLVEVILGESKRIVRQRPGLLITEHRLGYVMANAGVDHSNVAADGRVLLLPRDPDASAELLRKKIGAHCGCELAVIISDSFGRPWRRGTVGVALGAAGIPALVDLRGCPDLFGRKLEVTLAGFADAIASAAALVMGEAAEGVPAVLVRGLAWSAAPSPAAELIRPAAEDLFR
jgi:coenzyme F420-0:L-glutamate ligase / coenzyme F420-1:gamma-L-glutamate ligase